MRRAVARREWPVCRQDRTDPANCIALLNPFRHGVNIRHLPDVRRRRPAAPTHDHLNAKGYTTIETTAMLLGGFGLLVLGAELLVRGASRLAGALGISPLVIGLTVVAYGTSAPELAVSLQAALAGNADIAVGNVVGSNIFNVLFILGACAAIAPLVVSRQLVRLEVPIMIGISVLLLASPWTAVSVRLDGDLLASGIVAYTGLGQSGGAARSAARSSRRGGARRQPVRAKTGLATSAPGGRHGVGLALLDAGSPLVGGRSPSLCAAAWVSATLVIGLTIVAGGTSMPEVVDLAHGHDPR
ncbi:MAG: hypothetical protein MZV70_41085 [Desulfobacterales bacterium]|nr:hypothetical protein [Desulfobacterales bacterium]